MIKIRVTGFTLSVFLRETTIWLLILQLSLASLSLLLIFTPAQPALATTKTYDFSSGAGTNKWAYYKTNEGSKPPASGPAISGESQITSADYSKIATSDNTRYKTTITRNYYAIHHFKFTISEDLATMTNIHVLWEGYGTQTQSDLYIWNFGTSTWEHIGTGASTKTDNTISKDFTTNFSNYVDTSGYLHLVAISKRTAALLRYLYTDYIKIVLTTGNPPNDPVSLTQYQSNHSTTIPTGDWTSDGATTNIYLDMTMSSPNATDSLTPKVEVKPIGEAFTNTPTHTGSTVAYNGTPVTGSVTITGLNNGKQYHWQAMISGTDGESNWVSYGGNPETERDFGVDVVAPGPKTTATTVVGQADFTSNGSGTTASTLNRPYSCFVDSNGKFFVADRANNRVLICNSVPTSSGAAADVVVGQTDMTTNTSGTSATKFWSTRGVYSDGTKLYVVDHNNHRVLIWNTIPVTNGEAADVVIGQPNMDSGAPNQGGSVGANTLYYPNRVWTEGTKLYIADEWNHRILIYNAIPTTNNASADVVVGQKDFTSNTANQGGSIGANTLNKPHGLCISGGKMYIADTDNHRVLIYNTIPTTNNASADVVVGQADFTSGSVNRGGSVAANTLSYPTGVYVDGTKLHIADSNNHRVLVYNSIPTTNGAPADVVFGQPNMTSNTANNGGVSANSLYYPTSVFAEGARIYIADHNNNRVPIYAFDLESPANDSKTTNTSPDFSWHEGADYESGLSKYQLWIDGLFNKDVDPAVTSTNPTSPLSYGSHTWCVKAIDSASNIRQSPSVWTIYVTPVSITPNNSGSDIAGSTLLYTHTIENTSESGDTINLSASSSQGWMVGVYDSTGETPISSITLGPNTYGTVVVKVTIPSTAATGIVDVTTITGASTNSNTSNEATDTTTVV